MGDGQWGAERIPGRLHAVSADPDAGLKIMNLEIMTQGEIKSWMLERLSHLGAPCGITFIEDSFL